MSNKIKTVLVLGVVFVVGTASFINFFIWPFKASSPNYSDVEKAFNEIKIPDGWQITSITENKGTAGRTCPIEDSGCFSKRALLKLPEGVDSTVYTRFLADIGCTTLSVSDTSNKTTKMQTYYCNLKNGIKLGSDFRVDDREASITTFTD